MKILVADDDTPSRMILKAILTKWEYEVVEASSGDEAWEALQKQDGPQLVILDWMMPKMSGDKLCRKVRETYPLRATYIILLTSNREKEDFVRGLEAGANDYIRKPFDRAELQARIKVGERVVELEAALAQRIRALQGALTHVKTLQELLPICMHCHKIRNDQQTWERLEKYIAEHTEAESTHNICPDCMQNHYTVSPLHQPNVEETGDAPK
jgi:phosphoserine phosphatase RsbU/P